MSIAAGGRKRVDEESMRHARAFSMGWVFIRVGEVIMVIVSEGVFWRPGNEECMYTFSGRTGRGKGGMCVFLYPTRTASG